MAVLVVLSVGTGYLFSVGTTFFFKEGGQFFGSASVVSGSGAQRPGGTLAGVRAVHNPRAARLRQGRMSVVSTTSPSRGGEGRP